MAGSTTSRRRFTDGAGSAQYQNVIRRDVGGNTSDIPMVRETGGALGFGTSSTGNVFDAKTAAGFSAALSVDGFESVVLKTELSKATTTVKIRPWYIDPDGNALPGPVVTLVHSGVVHNATNSPCLKSGYYHGEVVELPTYGATSVKVELVSISNGAAISAWGCAR